MHLRKLIVGVILVVGAVLAASAAGAQQATEEGWVEAGDGIRTGSEGDGQFVATSADANRVTVSGASDRQNVIRSFELVDGV